MGDDYRQPEAWPSAPNDTVSTAVPATTEIRLNVTDAERAGLDFNGAMARRIAQIENELDAARPFRKLTEALTTMCAQLRAERDAARAVVIEVAEEADRDGLPETARGWLARAGITDTPPERKDAEQ